MNDDKNLPFRNTDWKQPAKKKVIKSAGSPSSSKLLAATRQSNRVPANSLIIELEKQYLQLIPSLTESKITSLRRFILEDLVPLGISLKSGIDDAVEIGQHVIAADFHMEAGLHKALQSTLAEAMTLKVLTFISGLANLNEQEQRMLLVSHLVKTSGVGSSGGVDLVKQILSSLFKVPNVQGSKEGSELLLREVSSTPPNRRRKSTGGSGPSTKEEDKPRRKYPRVTRKIY